MTYLTGEAERRNTVYTTHPLLSSVRDELPVRSECLALLSSSSSFLCYRHWSIPKVQHLLWQRESEPAVLRSLLTRGRVSHVLPNIFIGNKCRSVASIYLTSLCLNLLHFK